MHLEFLFGHDEGADTGEGEGGGAADVSDGEGVEGFQCTWSGGLGEGGLDLEVAVQPPSHQHHLLTHVAHQRQTVVLSTLQLK